MSQKDCRHKWGRVLVSGLPSYKCRICGAVVFEAVQDENLTREEMLNPLNAIRSVPDFGAPCKTFNLRQRIRKELKEYMRTRPSRGQGRR